MGYLPVACRFLPLSGTRVVQPLFQLEREYLAVAVLIGRGHRYCHHLDGAVSVRE
jgi:hypothetical protein